MLAAIDLGTNTVRLLVGQVAGNRVLPHRYRRRITRLGGGFGADGSLHPEAIARTLDALREFSSFLDEFPGIRCRTVGTAILRRASNAREFLTLVERDTGLSVEIISGDEEALLMGKGVRSALRPPPDACLIADIGGGSTEITFYRKDQAGFHTSLPLGVVDLCERFPSEQKQRDRINEVLAKFHHEFPPSNSWDDADLSGCPLVGTAGTFTTLAALQLGMTDYDWRRVNNFVLHQRDLEAWYAKLAELSPEKRERLPGMEKGRGDLILPGLRIVLSLAELFEKEQVTVSDFGLLEGVLLDLAENRRGALLKN